MAYLPMVERRFPLIGDPTWSLTFPGPGQVENSCTPRRETGQSRPHGRQEISRLRHPDHPHPIGYLNSTVRYSQRISRKSSYLGDRSRHFGAMSIPQIASSSRKCACRSHCHPASNGLQTLTRIRVTPGATRAPFTPLPDARGCPIYHHRIRIRTTKISSSGQIVHNKMDRSKFCNIYYKKM